MDHTHTETKPILPGKGDAGCPDPAMESMKLMEVPLFLSDDRVPKSFDGTFRVGGKVRSRVSHPLLAPDSDVFASIVDLAAKATHNRFDRQRFYIEGADFLRSMGWGTRGEDYARLEESIKRLYAVSVEVDGITVTAKEDEGVEVVGRAGVAFRLISAYRWEGEGNIKERYWLEMSKSLQEILQHGNWRKQIHQVRFRLESKLARRLVELISVKASDLASWQISVFTLAELVPLWGTSYKYRSTIMQKLKPALDELQATQIIHGYEFVVEDNRFLVIRPNPKYFYFDPRKAKHVLAPIVAPPVTPPPAAPVVLPPLAHELMKRGLIESAALDVLKKAPSLEAVEQGIEAFDIKKKSGFEFKTSEEGWLVSACVKGYKLPKGHKSKAEQRQEKEAADRKRAEKAQAERLEAAHKRHLEEKEAEADKTLTAEQVRVLEQKARAEAEALLPKTGGSTSLRESLLEINYRVKLRDFKLLEVRAMSREQFEESWRG